MESKETKDESKKFDITDDILLPLMSDQEAKDLIKREQIIDHIDRQVEEFRYRQLGDKGLELKFHDFIHKMFYANECKKIMVLPVYSEWLWTFLHKKAKETKHSLENVCLAMMQNVEQDGEFSVDINPMKVAKFIKDYVDLKREKFPIDTTLQCMNLLVPVQFKTKNFKQYEYSVGMSRAKYDIEYCIREVMPTSQEMTEKMQDYMNIIISKQYDTDSIPIGKQALKGISGSVEIPAFGFWIG
jgi:hypothetical protein